MPCAKSCHKLLVSCLCLICPTAAFSRLNAQDDVICCALLRHVRWDISGCFPGTVLLGVVFAVPTWKSFAIFAGTGAAPKTTSLITPSSAPSAGTSRSSSAAVRANRDAADSFLVLSWPFVKPCGPPPPHCHLQSASEATLDFTRGDTRRRCEKKSKRKITPARKSAFDDDGGEEPHTVRSDCREEDPAREEDCV